MGFRLGNLKLNEVVSRLGIQLSDEDSKWFKESRVDKVSDQFNNNYKISKNTWHAFDLPSLQIHAGSKRMANEITSKLKVYMVDGRFPGSVASLGITYEILKEERFGYNERKMMEDEDLAIYYGYYEDDFSKEIRFYVKMRETSAGNILLQEVEKTTDDSNWTEHQKAVPNVLNKKQETIYKRDENGKLEWVDNGLIPIGRESVKEIRRKKNDKDEYVVKESSTNIPLKRWVGEPLKNKTYKSSY